MVFSEEKWFLHILFSFIINKIVTTDVYFSGRPINRDENHHY
jgi:hypothetical protein